MARPISSRGVRRVLAAVIEEGERQGQLRIGVSIYLLRDALALLDATALPTTQVEPPIVPAAQAASLTPVGAQATVAPRDPWMTTPP